MNLYLSRFCFPTAEEDWDFFAGQRMTCYDSYYPYYIKMYRHLDKDLRELKETRDGLNGLV